MNFVKAFARHLERLGRGGVLERKRMRSIRLRYIDGRAALAGGPQLNIRTSGDVGGAVLLPAQIARRFLDERNEGSMQRKIVRDVVEGGGEDEDAAFADLLFEQERRLVGEARDDTRRAGVDLDHLIKLDAIQLVGASQGGMLGVGRCDGFKARATQCGVAGALDRFARYWNP